MGLILILIGLILVIGYCFYTKYELVTGLLILCTVLYTCIIMCISHKYVASSKQFTREYEVISELKGRGINNSYMTERIVWINKAILYERDLRDSKWTNWLGNERVAELKLLE